MQHGQFHEKYIRCHCGLFYSQTRCPYSPIVNAILIMLSSFIKKEAHTQLHLEHEKFENWQVQLKDISWTVFWEFVILWLMGNSIFHLFIYFNLTYDLIHSVKYFGKSILNKQQFRYIHFHFLLDTQAEVVFDFLA